MVNPVKLHTELVAAGIAISGCDSNGIVFDLNGNQIQSRSDVKAIIAAHIPTKKTWEEINRKRNELLLECAWTQLPDTPLVDAQKSEWQTYRETLQIIEFSAANPDAVVFPGTPTFINTQPPAEVINYRISRADLKAQATAAITRLTQIEAATNPTNAQMIQAVKDMAVYERKIINVLIRLI